MGAAGIGNGATVAFSGGLTFAAEIRDIGTFDPQVPAVDITKQSTSNYQEKAPGRVMEHGDVPIKILWDGSKATSIYNGAHNTRIIGRAGTITITMPKTALAAAAGAILTGTGFFRSFPTPQLTSNGLMETTALWCFDGQTAPSWTNEA